MRKLLRRLLPAVLLFAAGLPLPGLAQKGKPAVRSAATPARPAAALAPLGALFEAYSEEEAVGCGAFKEFSAGEVEIKRMYVLPAHRGQGVARAVLTELERWARELHYAACVLETGRKQPEAIRLYQKSGYVFTPNYGQYVGVANSVCLRKEVGRD